MSNTTLRSVAEVASLILSGRVLLLAGDETLLAQLPAGAWIGGTSVNFISEEGGATERDRILVTDITDHSDHAEIRRYPAGALSGIGADYPANGFTVLILPGLSEIHAGFARDVQTYDGVFNSPLVGWISAVHLSEIGQRTPKCFAGSGAALENEAAVMHVTLPAGQVAHLDTINLFTQGEGDVFEFAAEGFAVEGECFINGAPANFAEHVAGLGLDTQLPLVADYNGAMVNVAIRSIDVETGQVQFYAPVFKGVKYRFANRVPDFLGEFERLIGGSVIGSVAFSCNCILNYTYAHLEGKKTGVFVGPISFGEVAYVLLNQTLVYLSIDEREASAEILRERTERARRWRMVSRNIEDRRRTQESLERARDEANAANRAKSEFLANMSHEIRTPMNGVMGMTALLLRGDLAPEQRRFAEAIKTSADCLLAIINDILDISKLEAGKVELEIIDFSLEKVIEDVVELLAPRALDQGLEIVSHLDPGARRPLKGDPTRLRQILLNLLSNALKFTERGFVSVEVLSDVLEDGRTGLRLEVSDTGIGLTPEAKEKLFQKFQQADGSITRRFGGTGLGLSICRELVGLMGGRIGVDDRRGGGSIFWVEIELEAGVLRQTKLRPPVSLGGVRILVVDDLEINRTIFRRQLEGEGAVVAEASDGEACLAALARAQAKGLPFDLVLLDHMMPGMSGDIVAERICVEAGPHRPRLVLASSIGVPLSTDRAAGAGFDAFLSKPVRHQALVDCLSGLMADAHAEAEVGAAVKTPTETATAGGETYARVLLVEDNAINTLLATTLLEAAGYRVEATCDGLQAVAAAKRSRFDLILMDVHMPVMDGLEASRQIRALGGSLSSIPIVAMTANAMASDRDVCIAAGMNDFVSKPFDPEVFLTLVARYVEPHEPEEACEGAVTAAALDG